MQSVICHHRVYRKAACFFLQAKLVGKYITTNNNQQLKPQLKDLEFRINHANGNNGTVAVPDFSKCSPASRSCCTSRTGPKTLVNCSIIYSTSRCIVHCAQNSAGFFLKKTN